MTQVVASTCPLCHSAAKCENHVMRRLKHYVCPICKEVIVKNKAEQWLSKASEQARHFYSHAASQVESGLVYFISQSSDAALATDTSLQGQSMKYEDAMKL
jgi:hypothetical protein